MWASLFLLILGAVLLYLGGESLVRGAVGLAQRLGLTPLAIGLTVVAFGTSCPELAVSLTAASGGKGEVALGNAVGSNIANVGLILGLTALTAPIPIDRQVRWIDLPVLVVVTAIAVFAAGDGQFGRFAGALFVGGLLIYVAIMLRASRNGPAAEPGGASPSQEAKGALIVHLLLVAAGLAMLVFGGNSFVEGALRLARLLSVPEAIISLTIVALGTSLPELATSLVAVGRKHGDIVLGNVIGSCLFNLLFVIGLSGIFFPMAFPGIQWRDVGTMMGITLLLIPLIGTGKRLSRPEGGLLLFIYLGYIAWLAVDAGLLAG